jgi:cell division protein YceG involved in septum cleavage
LDFLKTLAILSEEQGIIRSSFFVRVMVKVFGSYSKLKSGYYDVVPNMSTMDLLDDFASATVATGLYRVFSIQWLILFLGFDWIF